MKGGDLMDFEIREIRDEIRKFQDATTGMILTKDIGKILRCLHLIPTNLEVNNLANLLDPNKTGLINPQLLYSPIAGMRFADIEEYKRVIWGAFGVFDPAGNGTLTPQTLRSILREIGLEPIPEKEVEAIIQKHVDRSTGLIPYASLIEEWSA
ncbi:unnamed protein product [Calicophoron daubneyi]|uniref:EF-hand domain-containing protein n=1 Tax=Calicophoron daubneyi TaxID=300641 RepID=A0AAV2TWM8_CALDB